MNESRYGDQQHNNTNDDDRTNVEWQQSAEHREDPYTFLFDAEEFHLKLGAVQQ